MVTERVILVTGANRGIGLAIVQALARHAGTANCILLLGCRELQKGRRAIEELRQNNIVAEMNPVQIDVESDASIRAAVDHVQSTYDRLDVLVNNAGFAMLTSSPDLSDVREAFSATYSTNVTSVFMTTSLFLPLLRASGSGRSKVINVSSARGSMARSSCGLLPPTQSVAYCVSKTALNATTIEMSRQSGNEGVEFQLASPGHCKTAFNGFRGLRDPVEGANVVVELVLSERRSLSNWETIGSDLKLVQVPW